MRLIGSHYTVKMSLIDVTINNSYCSDSSSVHEKYLTARIHLLSYYQVGFTNDVLSSV